MKSAVSAREVQNQLLIDQGIEQGAFDMAVKFKNVLGIEKVLELTDFSREELESEKLNR